ncbi:MAG: YdcF-like protein [Pseudolabrys sp.]|jgi:uncharacterized SAM-binding protein YcdF (DUF218 family)|nr:YdcF-like protein [Pseudolabrys sp.]
MFSGFARWVGLLTMLAVTAAGLVLAVGFVWFVWQVPAEETHLDVKADGIVVLTGAATRIPDAIELLTTDHGSRLLITGVHRTTSAKEIARLTSLNQKIFSCCVDLDRSALNTFGNALETKRWARERGFNSLIIVTSNWHMPRAMAEMSHQLPDIKLIAYPVVSDKVKTESWWSDPGIMRVLVSEYLKYVFAVVRMHLDPDYG